MLELKMRARLVVLFSALALPFASGIGLDEASAKTVVVERTTIYISTLPKGCVRTVYDGDVVVWRCGELFYQPYEGRYVRVYIK